MYFSIFYTRILCTFLNIYWEDLCIMLLYISYSVLRSMPFSSGSNRTKISWIYLGNITMWLYIPLNLKHFAPWDTFCPVSLAHSTHLLCADINHYSSSLTHKIWIQVALFLIYRVQYSSHSPVLSLCLYLCFSLSLVRQTVIILHWWTAAFWGALSGQG